MTIYLHSNLKIKKDRICMMCPVAVFDDEGSKQTVGLRLIYFLRRLKPSIY